MNRFVSTKDVRLNIRIDEETRRKFAICAKRTGISSAAMIHMFIAKTIREQEERDPSVFIESSEGDVIQPRSAMVRAKVLDIELNAQDAQPAKAHTKKRIA